MTIGFVSEAEILDPSSQGADANTRLLSNETQPVGDDRTSEAEGASRSPAPQSGGSSDADASRPAPITEAGGGGGSKDDPWSRAALKPQLGDSGVFDLAHRSDAVFLTRVQSCLPHDIAPFAGVSLAVTLDGDGNVAALKPFGSPLIAPSAVNPEPQAVVAAAVRACGPYRDASMSRDLTLTIPRGTAPA